MIWLIFAHFIGDWGLQARWIADAKGKYWEVMFAHCAVWTGCICIALEYLGMYNNFQPVFLFLGHWLIDAWKCKTFKNIKESRWTVHADHLGHLAQLIVVCYL